MYSAEGDSSIAGCRSSAAEGMRLAVRTASTVWVSMGEVHLAVYCCDDW